MPVYHTVGSAVVTRKELRERSAELTEAAREGVARMPPATATPFTPIGIGKPLTIQIRHVYTGANPRKGWFPGRKDMLLTSAMKSIAVFNAAPRAVNFLRQGVTANSNLNSPQATEQGTPLVYYSPAVTAPSTVVTFELVFDEFPDELLERIGTMFSDLSAVPIFLPAGGYLVAASSLVKLAGGLGQALFDGRPAFESTETLDFDVPGSVAPTADFRIMCGPDFDPTAFRFEPNKGLLDQHGKPYDDHEPYIVLSLDGAKREEYESFTPTMASAAVLERFFNAREGAEVALDTVVSAMKLYNDWKFRDQAKGVKQKLDALSDKNSDEAKKLTERYQALLANILTEEMKPKNGA